MMIPAVINDSDPKWECIIRVLLRRIKEFTRQKGQCWEHGQTPEAHLAAPRFILLVFRQLAAYLF